MTQATSRQTRPVEETEILRYAAFALGDQGGNPAGVVLDATGLDAEQMQTIAAQVGYSETAFLFPGDTGPRRQIRYFSPLAEVAFCGHATIATAVAFAERYGPGELNLATPAGPVSVATEASTSGIVATLTSVPTSVRALDETILTELLSTLRWEAGDLDPQLPPRIANAGNDHPVLAVTSRERLADLEYDFPRLADLMDRLGWTTVHLVWREDPATYHARDPFPPGGVVEDPATGAAAAAFGAYLRDLGLAPSTRRVTVRQGEDMGSPSELVVEITEGADEGIKVSGTARPLDQEV